MTTSAYLDSDSDSELDKLSDISDVDLPASVLSPSKVPRLSETRDVSSSLALAKQDSNPAAKPPSSPVTSKVLLPPVLKTPDGKQKCFRISSPLGEQKYALTPNSKVYQSPSPRKLVERHGKALHQQGRLAKKVEKLTADIKTRNKKTSKLEEYKSKGGIRGLSRNLEEHVRSTSSEGDGDEDSIAGDAPHSKQHPVYNESNKFPFPLSSPGFPVFIHPPNLITELYPSGFHEVEGDSPFNNLETNMMMQQNPEVLSQLICDRWFLLCYRIKPCPRIIWEWLFQIMCRSHDQHVAERAYMNLKTLVDWTQDKSVVFVPLPCSVLDILITLGADREQLEGNKGGAGVGGRSQGHVTAKTEPSDDVFQPSPLGFVSNLCHLFHYLSLAVTAHPSALSIEHLHQLFSALAVVSLDSSLNKIPHLISSISECLCSLVGAIPKSCWLPTSLPSLCAGMVQLSSHHHDLLHLTRLLMSTSHSTNMKQLQKEVCKASIWKIVFPGVPLTQVPDWRFAWSIVEHYYKMPAVKFIYYAMYSVACLLSQVLHLCPPVWPSAEEKRDFKSMLRKLSSVKIRDSAERTERAPVKDLFIRMSLEMAAQRSKDSVQLNLFGN